MQLHPFQGEYKEFPHPTNSNKAVDEFEILALAKRLGISIEEMKQMSFVSLMNILISSLDNEEETMGNEEDVRRMFG